MKPSPVDNWLTRAARAVDDRFSLTDPDRPGARRFASVDKRKREAAVSKMTTEEKDRLRTFLNGEMYVRASAVVQQSWRIINRTQAAPEFQADCWLLAETLRSTIRAGEACLLGDESPKKSWSMRILERAFGEKQRTDKAQGCCDRCSPALVKQVTADSGDFRWT